MLDDRGIFFILEVVGNIIQGFMVSFCNKSFEEAFMCYSGANFSGRNLMKHLRFLFFCAVLAPLLVAHYQIQHCRAYDTSVAENFVEKTADSVLHIVTSNATDLQKAKQLEKLFLDTVNIEWMARFVLAKNLRILTTNQYQNYLAAYKLFLLKSYVPKFRNYNGQHFKILSSKALESGQFIVTTSIIDPNTSSEVNVGYRCKVFKDGRMRIIDIIAENVSLMVSQRSEFSAIISNDGVDFLISQLNKSAAASSTYN